MIPLRPSDLHEMIGRCEKQTAKASAFVNELTIEQLSWQPDGRWSVLQQIEHLSVVNEPYLGTVRDVLEADPVRSDGPYRHPWFAKWFARTMSPPVKRRFKTQKVMVPGSPTDAAAVLDRFGKAQAELIRLMTESEGVDLGRVRFSSPFAKLVRLSLGTTFATLVNHNDRHLWLADEVIGSEGFPAAGTPS